jgi:hypothetical protein
MVQYNKNYYNRKFKLMLQIISSMALPLPDNPNISQPDLGEVTLVPKDKFRMSAVST